MTSLKDITLNVPYNYRATAATQTYCIRTVLD